MRIKCNHSHQKRKDKREVRAERAVLCAYVENHAILEPILLYRASKYKQTIGLLRLLENSHFPSYMINIKVFTFLCQDTNMAGSSFVKKCCNSSKKQISTI